MAIPIFFVLSSDNFIRKDIILQNLIFSCLILSENLLFLQLLQEEEGKVTEIVDRLNKFCTRQVSGFVILHPLIFIRVVTSPFCVEVQEEQDAGKNGERKVEEDQPCEGKDCFSGKPLEGAFLCLFVNFEG